MKMPVTQSDTPILSAWETSMIDVFVRAAGLIGLPRSIGEIYGLLFCSPKALSFDELVAVSYTHLTLPTTMLV